MANDNELVIKINGNLKGYKAALKAAAKETEDLQTALNQIAKTGAVFLTAFAGTAVLATIRFAEFDHGLRGVKTLLDESSFSTKTLDQGFQDLSKGALKALSDFPLTLQSINKSLFDIVSAGVPAAKAIDVLGSTSRLAVAGLTESKVATDGVTSALNAYGLSAKDSELVAAKLFSTQKRGKTTIEELSGFFGRAGAASAAYGVKLDELLAAVAAVTTGGVKTAAAFSGLPAVFTNIAAPTEKAIDEAKRLGIEFNSTALRTKGLTKFIDDLTTAQGFNAQSVEKLFGSQEAQKIMFALTGDAADEYKKIIDELADSQKILTTFTEAYETQNKSLKNQMIILRNNFDALAIMIGANLAPIVEHLATIMTGFLKFLQANPALANVISKLLIMGTVTAALTMAVGLGGLAFLKLRGIQMALAATTRAASMATWGLTAATKGATKSTTALKFAVKGLIGSTGLGLLIAFLPEIVQLFQWAFGTSTKTVESEKEKQKKLLEKNNAEIKKIEKKLLEETIANQSKVSDTKLQKLKEENARIKAFLEGQQKEKIAFLKRSQEIEQKRAAAEKETDKNRRIAMLENVKLLNEQLIKEEKDSAAKQAKTQADKDEKAEKEKQKEEEKLQDRIGRLADENEAIKAAQMGQEEEEAAFLKRRQDLRDQELEAGKIANEDERNLALENVRLKNEELLIEEADFFARRDELRAEQLEAEAAIKEELDALSAEQRKAIQQAEIDDLIKSFESKEEARSKAAKKELLNKRKENKLFLAEEEKHGTTIANLKSFFRSEQFEATSKALNALASLQNSANKTFKGIGKAAALVQIAIATPRGAFDAYTSFAKYGPWGVAAGTAAASAIIATGAIRAAQVTAAQRGGFITGQGGIDSQLVAATPGEFMVPPQTAEEVINAVAEQRIIQRETEGADEGEPEEGETNLRISVDFESEEAADIITVRQNEENFLGTSQAIT